MSDTPNLGLPYLAASQAQKHVTHNDALLIIDVLAQARAVSIGDTTPPGSPSDGDVYVPGSGATGAWSAWDWTIAYVADGAWFKIVPKAGWTIYNVADDTTYRYDAVSFWQPFQTTPQPAGDIGARLRALEDETFRLYAAQLAAAAPFLG